MADHFLEALRERVLVFDGAFGTWVQDKDLSVDDFGGPVTDERHPPASPSASVVRGPLVYSRRALENQSYYADKLPSLARLFGTDDIDLEPGTLRVGPAFYPIVDDVIVTLPEDRRPARLAATRRSVDGFAYDIQESFGREWREFDRVLTDDRSEFEQYFDLVDRSSLTDAVICDLGCGMGRWSAFLADSCRELVLVDFSEAIFLARRNFRDAPSTIFVMGDVTNLPFADDCCDFAMCLGVLHTLPTDPLDAIRSMRRLAPRLLIYLYYALDNRPAHYRALLRIVDAVRERTARLRDERVRRAISYVIAYGVYLPLIGIGRVARFFGLSRFIPLADDNAGRSMEGIRQRVYDRFFTSNEQRFTRAEIRSLERSFSRVRFSDGPPYWHFECTR
ncbi:MAG: methyltransferase domain-containing protein [Acidimicrobiia bacterium]